MLTQRLQNLQPYTPGEQPKDRPYIKLNANENPYPPSPQVTSAINKLLTDNPMAPALYPDPGSTVLRTAVARMLNSTGGVLCRTIEKDGKCIPASQDILPQQITADMIFTGNGSDEVLSFLFYAFFEQDRPIFILYMPAITTFHCVQFRSSRICSSTFRRSLMQLTAHTAALYWPIPMPPQRLVSHGNKSEHSLIIAHQGRLSL